MGRIPPSELVRDWSELPADLLLHVFSTLDIPDVFSSGAVCRNCRNTYLDARRCGSFSPDQSPCLVFASSARDPNTATLQNLITEKVYHISLPDPPFHSRYVMGSSHGWLVTADERSHLLLVNPVTGHRIAMPPPETMKNVELLSSTEGALDHTITFTYLPIFFILTHIRIKFFHWRRVVSTSTKGLYFPRNHQTGNCLVVTLQTLQGLIFYTRVGHSRWTWLDVDQCCCRYHDTFYNRYTNLLYAIREDGDVHAFDLSGVSPVFSIVIQTGITLIDNHKYIVQSEWGDLLQVWRYQKCVGGEPRTDTMVVYKIDLVEKKLVEVKDLQGYALFMGFTGSFFIRGKDFPMLAPNNIYYMEDYLEWIFCNIFSFKEIGAFSLEDGSFTNLLPLDS